MRQKECYVMRVKKKPAAEYQDDCSGEKQERRPTMHQATKAKKKDCFVGDISE